jgi:hypothetical protein
MMISSNFFPEKVDHDFSPFIRRKTPGRERKEKALGFHFFLPTGKKGKK